MPGSSGVTAAQQRFSDAVASLCTHLTAVASNVADASACVHDALSPAPPQGDRSNSHKDDAVVVAGDGHGCVSRSGSAAVARAAVQLQHGVDGCTRTLHDCLDDLRATTSAMTSVMQSCPEEAPRLLTNLFGALTRQVGTYYRDVGVVFATCEAALAEDRRHATTTTATATTTARGAKTPTTRQPHDHNDNNNNAPVPPRERSDDKPRTPTTTMTAATPLPPQPAHTVAVAAASSSSPREPRYLCVTTTVEEALGAAVIAARPGVFAPVAVLRAHAPVADYHVRLRHAGSLGDLVARAYVSVNEDVFADVLCEVLTSDCVELGPFESPTGDVVLPRMNSSSGSGSSGRGMSRSKDNNDTSNNDNGDDDDDGVVVDVSALPACAWRTCSNEEHTSSLYTSYALVREECARHDDDGVNDDGTGGERVLLVHDVVHIDNDDSSNSNSTAAAGRRRVREEVLHVVTLVPSAGAVTAAALAPFARVRAYTMTTTTTAAGSTTTTSSSSAAVAAVLVSLSRTLYTRVGFAAVAESDVRDYVREQRRHGGGSSSNVGNGDDDEDAAALQQQMAAATASRRARRAGKTRAKGNNNNNNSSSSSTAAASNNNNSVAAAALSSGSSGEAVLAQLPHYRATTPRDATVTFQPNVQLASLSEPDGAANNNYSGGNDNNSSFVSSLQSLTVSGVAKGAVRGGLEVLRAPLTVGRAVSGAVLDATGVTDAMRSNMESTFRRTFPQLAGEVMVDSFGCAWQDGGALPKQGNLFITPHWLCFQSSVAAAQFAVEYDEIKDIRKAKVAKLFDTAMEVVTHVGDTYVLVNFLQRDQAYTTVMQQWLK